MSRVSSPRPVPAALMLIAAVAPIPAALGQTCGGGWAPPLRAIGFSGAPLVPSSPRVAAGIALVDVPGVQQGVVGGLGLATIGTYVHFGSVNGLNNTLTVSGDAVGASFNPAGIIGPQGLITSLTRRGSVSSEVAFVAGGEFETVFNSLGLVPANSVAWYGGAVPMWRTMGLGVTFASGAPGRVRVLAALPDAQSVLVGGEFDVAGGLPAPGLARYAFATDTWTPITPALPGIVTSMSTFPPGAGLNDNDVLIGLEPRLPSSTDINESTVWLWSGADGSLTPLGRPDGGTVRSVRALSDGTMYAGTDRLSRLVSIAAQTFTTVAFPAGGAPIHAMEQIDSDLLIGGSFAAPVVEGGVSVNIARFRPATGDMAGLGGGVPGPGPITAIFKLGSRIYASGYVNGTAVQGSPLQSYTAGTPAPTFIGPSPTVSCGRKVSTMSVATASGSGSFAYQWQWRPLGSTTWQNIAAGPNRDGGAGPVLFGAQEPQSPTITLIPGWTDAPGNGAAVREVRVVVTDTTPAACALPQTPPVTWTVCPADIGCDGARNIDDIFVFLSQWFGGC